MKFHFFTMDFHIKIALIFLKIAYLDFFIMKFYNLSEFIIQLIF